MYYNGQIVWDLDAKKPVQVGGGDTDWAWDNLPPRTTHFLHRVGHRYEIALPATLEEAEDLLAKNLITPAPTPPTHCWKCLNWLSNCGHRTSKCSEREASAAKL